MVDDRTREELEAEIRVQAAALRPVLLELHHLFGGKEEFLDASRRLVALFTERNGREPTVEEWWAELEAHAVELSSLR